MKQTVLKPQDVVMAIHIGLAAGPWPFAQLGQALVLSASEAHASVQRGVLCGLLVREFGELHANRTALAELLAHGLRYVFPPVFGSVAQGVPTGSSTPPLAAHFAQGDALPWVWPQAQGPVRGLSLCPLYPSVPLAVQQQPKLHEALALVDAVRAGTSRERELALQLLAEYWV